MVTALRRLSKPPKSVSEQHLSLIDRPRPPEGRFQNTVQLQLLDDFGRASFSKVQVVSKFAFEQKRRSHCGVVCADVELCPRGAPQCGVRASEIGVLTEGWQSEFIRASGRVFRASRQDT